ncbi:MAG: LysM peptidoglycan-binding domain-containing protein [Phycisphaerae bacterium]|nr:LysM peptidoglycan-binding domain-containing protein [Phycisphaerae bacterium]
MKLTNTLLIVSGFLFALNGYSRHAAVYSYGRISPGLPPQLSLSDVISRPIGMVIPTPYQWHISYPGVLKLSELTRNIHAPNPIAQAHWGQMAHRVTQGDSLYRIAETYYGDVKYWRVIVQENQADLPADNQVKVDQLIYLPIAPTPKNRQKATPPTHLPDYYITNKGDTLYSIAQKITGDGNQYKKILNANRKQLQNPGKLAPGLMLKIRR